MVRPSQTPVVLPMEVFLLIGIARDVCVVLQVRQGPGSHEVGEGQMPAESFFRYRSPNVRLESQG